MPVQNRGLDRVGGGGGGGGGLSIELTLLASKPPPPCAFVLALTFLTFSCVCV